MNIIESKSVKASVDAKMKQDMRDQLKRLATEYVHTSDPMGLIAGMKLAAKYTEPSPDIIVVNIHQGLLIFSLKDRTQEEWLTQVTTLSKKELATPRKVLVKSVALRMQKARNTIKRDSEYRTREGRGLAWSPMPDLETQKVIGGYASTLTSQGARGEVWEKMEDLLQFSRRDDVDDSIIHDAWCLVVTREVMES